MRDRRSHALTLADKGRRRLAELDRIVVGSDAQLTAAEKRQLRRLLDKLSPA